jgi:hypothetical protein
MNIAKALAFCDMARTAVCDMAEHGVENVLSVNGGSTHFYIHVTQEDFHKVFQGRAVTRRKRKDGTVEFIGEIEGLEVLCLAVCNEPELEETTVVLT